MKQSTIIFGAIVFAFVIYITVRGQLPDYLALFSGSKSSASSGGNADKPATSKPPVDQSFLDSLGSILTNPVWNWDLGGLFSGKVV